MIEYENKNSKPCDYNTGDELYLSIMPIHMITLNVTPSPKQITHKSLFEEKISKLYNYKPIIKY